ncbi:MAG: MFS transporter [Marmoricola sp.]
MFPLRARGEAASVATMANWTADLVVAVSYRSIISAIGQAATFWTYGVLCVLSVLYMAKAVPQTCGRSLTDIERELRPERAAAWPSGQPRSSIVQHFTPPPALSSSDRSTSTGS